MGGHHPEFMPQPVHRLFMENNTPLLQPWVLMDMSQLMSWMTLLILLNFLIFLLVAFWVFFSPTLHLYCSHSIVAPCNEPLPRWLECTPTWQLLDIQMWRITKGIWIQGSVPLVFTHKPGFYEAAGCILKFIPVYLPDFNPIKVSFSAGELRKKTKKCWTLNIYSEEMDSMRILPLGLLRKSCCRSLWSMCCCHTCEGTGVVPPFWLYLIQHLWGNKSISVETRYHQN